MKKGVLLHPFPPTNLKQGVSISFKYYLDYVSLLMAYLNYVLRRWRNDRVTYVEL
jgi:hypothetical protein